MIFQNETVNEAIEFIFEHIWEELSLEDVADHCHLSKYYFSRLFKKETGMSVYAFIKKTKMEQSAFKLKLERDRSVSEIGLDYGYSASNFSSAFSQYHKKSPIGFRNEAKAITKEGQNLFRFINEKIQIKTLPDYLVMYERFIGNYENMKYEWCCFMEKYNSFVMEDTICFERTYDDPTITDENKCLYDICMSIREEQKQEFENTCVLTGGKFAVYPFRGYIEEIFPIHQALIGIWFPLSHHEIDTRYSYDRYRRVEQDGYMEFDICIPIKR